MNASAGAASYSPYTAPAAARPAPVADLSVSPGLAFILGLIPGVGAIYNSQYAKGLIHVLILGTLISIGSNGGFDGGAGPLFGFVIAGFYFYMPFEAYHTARRRQLGEPVDEFSSLISVRKSNRFPIAPLLLIVIGVLFLLNNLDLLRFRDVARYWPVFLIAIGAYMLYSRLSGDSATPVNPEAANEQR